MRDSACTPRVNFERANIASIANIAAVSVELCIREQYERCKYVTDVLVLKAA